MKVMKKFEYQTIIRRLLELMSDSELNLKGSNGWELVSFALGEKNAVYVNAMFLKEKRSNKF